MEITLIILAVLPPVILKYYRPQEETLIAKITGFIKNLSWGAAIADALIIYFSLIALAVKFQKKKV